MNRLAGHPELMISKHDVEALFNVKMLPCPFCGGEPYLYASPSPHVVCAKCAADGPAFERRTLSGQEEAGYKAVMAWNVRTQT